MGLAMVEGSNRTSSMARENIATIKLNHCWARNAVGSRSTIGETKIAIMNKITHTTSAMVKILFIVLHFNTDQVTPREPLKILLTRHNRG